MTEKEFIEAVRFLWDTPVPELSAALLYDAPGPQMDDIRRRAAAALPGVGPLEKSKD